MTEKKRNELQVANYSDREGMHLIDKKSVTSPTHDLSRHEHTNTSRSIRENMGPNRSENQKPNDLRCNSTKKKNPARKNSKFAQIENEKKLLADFLIGEAQCEIPLELREIAEKFNWSTPKTSRRMSSLFKTRKGMASYCQAFSKTEFRRGFIDPDLGVDAIFYDPPVEFD